MEAPTAGAAPLDSSAEASAENLVKEFSSQLGGALRHDSQDISRQKSRQKSRQQPLKHLNSARASFSQSVKQSSKNILELVGAAPTPAEPPDEDEEPGGAGMSICIHPNIDLQINITGEPLDSATYCVRRYEVNGPHSKVAMLNKLLKRHAGKRSRCASGQGAQSPSVLSPTSDVAVAFCESGTRKERSSKDEEKAMPAVSGLLSPLHPVNLPVESRKGAGIPAAAAYFAFCYPADGMEKVLEPLNLIDQPWAFILLLGGFVYFDESFSTCGMNSIGMGGSKIMLDFVGPFSARQPAMDALDVEKRLCEVTLEALVDKGLASFGWVHPKETPGGERLHRKQDHPLGGFVYMRKHEPPILFVLTPSERGSASGGKRTDGTRDTVGGGAVNVLVNGVRDLAARVKKDRATTAKEIAEVQLLTTGRVRGASLGADPSTEKVLRYWFYQRLVVDLEHWRRFLTPIASGLCFLILCGSIAHYDRGTYKVLGSFLWYAIHVEITWRPMRDTAGLCILQHSKGGVRLLYAMLIGIPILLGILRFACHWVAYSKAFIETEQALMEGLSVGMIYLAVPLALYGLRRMAARQVKRKVSLQANAVGNLVKWKDEMRDNPPSPPSSPPPLDATPDAPNVEPWAADRQVTIRPRVAVPEAVIDNPTDASNMKPRAADKEHSIEYKVAVKFQCAIRRSQARRRVTLLLAEREASLLRFCWPIFLASLVDIVGTTVLVEVRQLISNTHTTTLRDPAPARFRTVGYRTNNRVTLRAVHSSTIDMTRFSSVISSIRSFCRCPPSSCFSRT